ncbi:hypothetical protein [Lysobacter sp. A289]
MNLKDARDNYYTFSGKASDIIRQLGLGSIAIIWIFRKSTPDAIAIPASLVLPLKLVVAGLAFDLLQYAIAAILWSFFAWRKERSGALATDDFKAPQQINWPAILFFYSKVVLIVLAYWHIFRYLTLIIRADA